ncbi:MAG TPA: MEMO1 family protein [Methanothrix sp.]|nr:MEMO1 family protein [Methanothrix sp.]HPC90203.1 MEMO1 family protein [Methanothrix sp.]HQE87754.1 MEMO1 family protein [Methanothrix sp.]HQI68517.1 MEMO1 family protein [Methanothrix sp.]HRS84570.1 MEMO1 family protein [Methanothrix sp.]
MRHPAVAGQFYPGSSQQLAHQVDGMLHDVAELPVKGAVAPHAGYIYSGQVAAEVYSRLPKAETYVLIGPNHHGLGSPVALSRDSWKTPLGVVETDQELADALAGGIIDHDETAHRPEHSVEVQIPFLQRRFADFKILPVCMGLQDMETAVEVGQEISAAAKKHSRKVVVIASSDFTHYEPQEIARKVDSRLLEAILNMDVSELYNRVYRYNASACGYGPIAATITAAAALGAQTGKLLCYATSGDVSGDYGQVVGYGAVVFT